MGEQGEVDGWWAGKLTLYEYLFSGEEEGSEKDHITGFWDEDWPKKLQDLTASAGSIAGGVVEGIAEVFHCAPNPTSTTTVTVPVPDIGGMLHGEEWYKNHRRHPLSAVAPKSAGSAERFVSRLSGQTGELTVTSNSPFLSLLLLAMFLHYLSLLLFPRGRSTKAVQDDERGAPSLKKGGSNGDLADKGRQVHRRGSSLSSLQIPPALTTPTKTEAPSTPSRLPPPPVEPPTPPPTLLSNQYYIIQTTPVHDADPTPLRSAHLKWLTALERTGSLFASGPHVDQTLPTPPPHPLPESMYIIRSPSLAAATATANTDPYNLECKTTFRVWPWAMDGGMISMTVSLANCEYRLE